MPANYVLLGEVTLGANAASVTFSNIPQTGYTDLKVVVSARLSTNVGANWYDLGLTFNGSSSGYSGRWVLGNGSAASSSTDGTSAYIIIRPPSDTATASTFGNAEIYIPNYTGSNNKSVSVDNVSETNATSAIAIMTASLWSNTAAITSMAFTAATGTIVANSTFYLYGIAAVGTTPVIAPFAIGGDVIQNDGTYWIHTFLSSGTFTPKKTLTCDALVVAGGGGAASANGSGGGAGGFRTSTGLSATSATAYAVTIGAGGTGGSGNSQNSTAGNDSIFSSITSTAGGRGVNDVTSINGGNGGSGGGGFGSGAPRQSPGTGNTPSTSPSQGNNGGAGSGTSSRYGSGGGGGANAVGSAGSGTAGGAGGAGTSNSYSGSAVTYAGGGGGGAFASGSGAGGAGGSGGGGAGASSSDSGVAGTANTGGGGGGGGDNGSGGRGSGGAGGSGIVIIRYPMV